MFKSVSDADEEGSRAFVKGGKRWEVTEQDVLVQKKEFSYELKEGEYNMIMQSLSSGKFKWKVVMSCAQEEYFKLEKDIGGSGKKARFETQITVRKDQEPTIFVLSLESKARFWNKASFRFNLVKNDKSGVSKAQAMFAGANASQRGFPRQGSFPNAPEKVKVKVQDTSGNIRYLNLPRNVRYTDLMDRLQKDHGDVILKYLDEENEMVTICTQEELETFFQSNIGSLTRTPKLYLVPRNGGGLIPNYLDIESVSSPSPSPTSARNMEQRFESVVSMNSNSSSGSNISTNSSFTAPNSARRPMLRPRAESSPPTTPSNGITLGVPLPSPRDRQYSAGYAPSPRPIRWQKGNMLGAGAFGKVYLGFNEENGKLMAVKQFDLVVKTGNANNELINKLQAEINVMKELDHPNIVRYLGMEKTREHINIFLDYIPGGSIESVIADFRLKESVVKKYTQQILCGLQYLHNHNILHRDIKGANILVDENGRVYLADFGSAKGIAENLANSRSKTITGTPNYMAPEVIRSSHYTKAADIWSLGCTVLEMLTRKPPWDHLLARFETPIQFFYYMVETDDTIPIPTNISHNARDFLEKCFQKNPEDRPSAEQLLQHPFIVEHSDEDFDAFYGGNDVYDDEADNEQEHYTSNYDPVGLDDISIAMGPGASTSSSNYYDTPKYTPTTPRSATPTPTPVSQPQPQPQQPPATVVNEDKKLDFEFDDVSDTYYSPDEAEAEAATAASQPTPVSQQQQQQQQSTVSAASPSSLPTSSTTTATATATSTQPLIEGRHEHTEGSSSEDDRQHTAPSNSSDTKPTLADVNPDQDDPEEIMKRNKFRQSKLGRSPKSKTSRKIEVADESTVTSFMRENANMQRSFLFKTNKDK